MATAWAATALPARREPLAARIAWLPSLAAAPVASSPLLGARPAAGTSCALAPWTIRGHLLAPREAIDLLCACVDRELLAPGVAVGKDLACAAHALRLAGALVARQRYLPHIAEEAGAYRAVWAPVWGGPEREQLGRLAAALPDSARAVGSKADAAPETAAAPLVEGFVEALVDALVRGTTEDRPRRRATGHFDSPHDEWVHALGSADATMHSPTADLARLANQVREWRRPVAVQVAAPYRLTFRLDEPAPDEEDAATWHVRYLLQATHDPSLLVPAAEVWKGKQARRLPLTVAGFDPREHLLAALGQASGLDPQVEQSLRSPAPEGYAGDTASAHDFLSHRAGALEQAGFGVLLPAWWTGKGTKQRLAATATVRSPKLQGGTGLSLADVLDFEWRVAIGDVPLTLAELRELARLKQPLVRVRGQWVQVSGEQIQAALRLLKEKGRATLRDVVRLSLGAEPPPGGLTLAGVEARGAVADLLASLHGQAAFEALPPPEGLQGELRPYQLRGYSWLAFLGRCGLGACLADDMGLGKTVQTLALIQRQWREGAKRPVLLVCPTSVVGNWQKEAARFTPELNVLIHHGQTRARGSAFAKQARRHAIVLSSYALLHRDAGELAAVQWGGVVLDEAQNIKNADTKQARAARALEAGYRIALTGTPVENNVGDLWSLLEFLNPGLLGSQAHFKRTFFVPIQASRDPAATERLRKLTGPFILRRLKTDKSVIADLPDKLEARIFCTLTREQASLYAAVVAEANQALESADGMKRKGLVLATLSKLKQVCNHPAHFLGDNSPLPGRSGKLARLTEMLEEALAAGDRALVFSQFAEMGGLLERHLADAFGHEVLFLHGGVSRAARDRMVERFQAKQGPPLFVLSLKAGGTGLNLTAASHVFHFDRWWNPAVENQATDRAFRIGQKRRVQVHKFLCAGTLEEKIDEMLERKQQVAQAVVGTGEGWLTELSTSELKELIALRPSALAD